MCVVVHVGWRNRGARPDFVLASPATCLHCLVIETMGYSDADYLARKARTIDRLSAYSVFRDDRTRQRL